MHAWGALVELEPQCAAKRASTRCTRRRSLSNRPAGVPDVCVGVLDVVDVVVVGVVVVPLSPSAIGTAARASAIRAKGMSRFIVLFLRASDGTFVLPTHRGRRA